MKQRFGALLCMILGGVLMVTGLTAGQTAVGGVTPTCQVIQIGTPPTCPTGTITVTEHTVQKGATLPLPSGGWKVDIASANCTLPNGDKVAETLTIADGKSATSQELFIFTDPGHDSKCQYTLTEQPVAGFTPTFVPPSPVTLPYSDDSTNSADNLVAPADPANNLAVALTNTSNAAPSTSAVAPSSTAAVASPSSSAAGLAATGPRPGVRISVWIGSALLALGLVLLLAGRRRRPHAH